MAHFEGDVWLDVTQLPSRFRAVFTQHLPFPVIQYLQCFSRRNFVVTKKWVLCFLFSEKKKLESIKFSEQRLFGGSICWGEPVSWMGRVMVEVVKVRVVLVGGRWLAPPWHAADHLIQPLVALLGELEQLQAALQRLQAAQADGLPPLAFCPAQWCAVCVLSLADVSS